jgi:hypothetical protein
MVMALRFKISTDLAWLSFKLTSGYQKIDFVPSNPLHLLDFSPWLLAISQPFDFQILIDTLPAPLSVLAMWMISTFGAD